MPGNPFDLDDDHAYQAWRARVLHLQPRSVQSLQVPVQDIAQLQEHERGALLQRVHACGMALYQCQRSARTDTDTEESAHAGRLRALGAQLGLRGPDVNWLADEDGVSRICVAPAQGDHPRADFIPYTDRAIRWHTDGYYHPLERRICSMLLHCVRPAKQGGENALADPQQLYIALRDANRHWVRALMQPDAMTIPARMATDGREQRAVECGPVFSVLRDRAAPEGLALHMRYTARTRSICWKDDAATQDAVQFLAARLQGPAPWIWRVKLEAGMGIVSHNVLHDRTAFVDDACRPRLILRARHLERMAPLAQPAQTAALDSTEALP